MDCRVNHMARTYSNKSEKLPETDLTSKVVLASNNAGKLHELRALLYDTHLECESQAQHNVPEVQEIGLTFIENAIIKARNACRWAHLPAIADDSGLEVDFLQGQPGVHSARYAGEGATDQKNLQKLLRELQGVNDKERTARFQCAVVYLRFESDPSPLVFLGTWEGQITTSAKGKNGFGYDSVFLAAGLKRTSAELEPEQKNRLSHRCKAMRQLVEKLQRQNLPHN